MKFCEHGADVLVVCAFCGRDVEVEWGDVSIAECDECGQVHLYKRRSNLFIAAYRVKS